MLNVMDEYPDMELLSCGDYNLPNIEWQKNDDDMITVSSLAQRLVYECFSIMLDAQQVTTIKNAKNGLLDLIFSTVKNLKIYAAEEILVEPNAYHPAMWFCLDFEGSPQSPDAS
ncbi:hypothetical protein HHI36_000933 [Cryptolaemus montrouzieri]|uniref:Endonuclease/exonuclease/phosphatase domain-containing protein n=1 Tax=Cryptolaemus montrouzieri TaxID=559131 RepID=A0ABD2P6C1_9CUCU